MHIIWISFLLFLITVAGNNIERATYCYGDNSASSNIVDVSCTSGAVYINDVIAAAKPTSLNCSAEDHIGNPAAPEICCTYNETDCMKTWSGTWDAYLNCIGKTTCYGVPVIRDEPICSHGDFPRYSNYMILEYYCIPAGHIFGPCTSTADCNDPVAMCNKTYCACQTGYTAFSAFDDCWRDGGLNGSCTGAVGCQDNSTFCNFTTGRCQCDVGYIAVNGSCRQGGHNFGVCIDTTDCTDPQALCDTSVCVCKDGYTAFTETDDCWKDGDLHGLCNIDTDCIGDNVECIDQRCECISGYRDIGDTCREDGHLNGYCESSIIECIDANTTCHTANDVCECIGGYTEIDETCKKDGDLHGLCNIDTDCIGDNVECIDQRCECISGYRDIGDTCREDGHLNGYCESSIIECIDANTTCHTANDVCECIGGYTEIDETCKKDGDLGGVCEMDGNCTDTNAECLPLMSNPALSVCKCIAGYTDINGQCIEDGDLHGFCMQDTDCLDDSVECVYQRCECIANYRDIDGECREDWHLQGFCEVTIDCVDDNTDCLEGICECVDGHTEIDRKCMKDGDIGGLCALDSDCVDDTAQCVTLSSNTVLSICECKDNYTDVKGECKQDRRLGGRCTNIAPCLDTSTNCSIEGICICIVKYSEVKNICKEDEREGGVCGQTVPGGNGGECSEEHTVCEVDTQLLCRGSNCIPGTCQCKQGYSIGVDSTCTEDGGIDGICNMDSDCFDANANCVGIPLFCTCSTGYRNVDGSCVKDGDPSGYCMSGDNCTDTHSVCVNGTCICNDVRNYIIRQGSCQRDDSYVNGECKDGICFDPNALCAGNKCICKTGYSQHNGVCTAGEISSVTSCNGSSPYNQLSPDCDQDSVPVIVDEYQRVKDASNNCPGDVAVYSDVIFNQCCSYDPGDCRLDGTGADACSPADLAESYTTFDVIDYICAKADSVIDASTNDDVTNNQVYVTISTDNEGDTGEKTCSVTVSCQTDISIYLVFLNFEKVNNQCSKTVTIIEGTSSTIFDCDYTVEMTTEVVYSTSAGFFIFRVTNPDQGGRFVMKIEVESTTADLLVACGSEAVSEGPESFGTCGPEAGRLGGECSPDIICVDPYTTCENGVCRCQIGYIHSNMECLESATQKEDETNQNAVLAVIIPVAILVVLAIAGILFWLLRDAIRKRCFPKQEPSLPTKHVLEGSTPMNIKYTGSGVPSDVKVPKAMPPPWINTAWMPPNEKFHGKIPNDLNLRKTLPPIIRPPVDATPMNMKFSGKLINGSGPVNVADYLQKEELEAHKHLNKNQLKKKVQRNSVSPTSVGHQLANGDAGSAFTSETKAKSKKKNKKIRKAQLRIKAKQAFELPKQLGNSHEGVYMPNEDFYSQSIPRSEMQYINSPTGQLPPLQNDLHLSNSFDPRASWRTAGTVVSVAVQPKVRRPSVIDIASFS